MPGWEGSFYAAFAGVGLDVDAVAVVVVAAAAPLRRRLLLFAPTSSKCHPDLTSRDLGFAVVARAHPDAARSPGSQDCLRLPGMTPPADHLVRSHGLVVVFADFHHHVAVVVILSLFVVIRVL